MSTAQGGERVAVFTRNYQQHLDGALEIAERDPAQFVTFRSSKLWASAKAALQESAESATLPVYIAVFGGQQVIEYEARLHGVLLNPHPTAPETKRVLAWRVPTTRKEELWSRSARAVRTLYILPHCRKVDRPFPVTLLTKVSDGRI